MTPLSAALLYASRGWHVFPCHNGPGCSCGVPDCSSPAKHPRTARGLHDATTDERQIRAWWSLWPNANVGVRTGAVSGFWVLDYDAVPKALGRHRPLVLDLSACPPTLTSRTPSGGLHLLYRGTTRTSQSVLGASVDTRGEGGYILAPPSVGANGQPYRWESRRHAARWEPTFPAVEAPAPRAAPPIPVSNHDRVTAYAQAVARGLAAVATDRWAATLRAARTLGGVLHHGLPVELATGLLLDAATGNGSREKYGDRKLLRCIADGLRMGEAHPLPLEDRERPAPVRVAHPAWDPEVPWP